MKDLLFNQYCQKKFNINSDILDDNQKQTIMDSLEFRGYLSSIEFDNIKKEIKKELKKIFRIK